MSPPPIPMRYEGEGEFRALPRFAKLADRHYVVGETTALVPHEDRSWNSHRHYFSVLKDAWDNLPEDKVERFPTPEHLRKYCLVRAGYANKAEVVCNSHAEAIRLIATMRGVNDYAVVTVNGNVATIFTAQSQSTRAMGAKVFQDSKQKVLDECARLIGVDPATLSANAARAA